VEQRAVIKFCIKLKKTATETFEMLKSVYGEEYPSKTSVFEWHKMFKDGRSRYKTMHNADCNFYAKVIIHHEFVPEKQTVNGNFYKKAIKRLIARVHRVRPEFPESGSWYLLHNNAPAHYSGVVSQFLVKRGIPVLSHPPHSRDFSPADIFIS
jgi:hypothetical protein